MTNDELIALVERCRAFRLGDMVEKRSGAEWVGRVVGFYSTEQTPEGYAVESAFHKNTVQIYPVAALRDRAGSAGHD